MISPYTPLKNSSLYLKQIKIDNVSISLHRKENIFLNKNMAEQLRFGANMNSYLNEVEK